MQAPVIRGIVEDNAQIREGLCSFLANSAGFACLATLGSAEDALASLPHLGLDVILMDIGLPGMPASSALPSSKL